MKNEIKNYLDQNSLVYPRYNNNISRKNYWLKRNPKWWNYLSSEYEKAKKIIYHLGFQTFIRYFFYDSNTYRPEKGLKLLFKPNNIVDYCKELRRIPNKQTHEYKYCLPLMVEYVEKYNLLRSENYKQQAYNIAYNIKSAPLCKECNNAVSWDGGKYHIFCSQQCQITHHNKHKEKKLSKLTDDEIRVMIRNINEHSRDITNESIANSFLNIENYINSLNLLVDLTDREKLYIFLEQDADVLCVCGEKKNFISKNKGFAKTCARKKCISIAKGQKCIDYSDKNIRTSKNGTKIKEGYIYIIKLGGDIYKIGITKNPHERFRAFFKIFSNAKIVYSVYKSNNVYKLEKKLHKLFKNKYEYLKEFGGKTETFKLTSSDIQYINGIINEY